MELMRWVAPGGRRRRAGRGDDVFAVTGDGDGRDIVDAEADDRGEDQIGPGETAGGVVEAERQVGVAADAGPLEHQPRRGPGEAGDDADLEVGGGQRGQSVLNSRHGTETEPL